MNKARQNDVPKIGNFSFHFTPDSHFSSAFTTFLISSKHFLLETFRNYRRYSLLGENFDKFYTFILQSFDLQLNPFIRLSFVKFFPLCLHKFTATRQNRSKNVDIFSILRRPSSAKIPQIVVFDVPVFSAGFNNFFPAVLALVSNGWRLTSFSYTAIEFYPSPHPV